MAASKVPRLVIYAKDLTFSEDDKLGRGGFGVVYRGVFRGRPVAVKIAHPSEELDMHEQFIEVLREVEPMQHLRHPNIVEFLGVCAADKKHGLMIVTELCEGGSLAAYLATNRPLKPEVRDRLIREICEGVQYLHDHGIAHLDLNPANILLTEGLVAKISDFGMTRNTQRTTSSFAGGGTYNFMSPEGLDPEKRGPPFEGQSPAAIITAVVVRKQIPAIPASLPANVKNAIKSSFAYKAANRPTAKQVLDKLGISPSSGSQSGTAADSQAPPRFRWGFFRGAGERVKGSASSPGVSAVGHSSGVHMSTASTTTGTTSSVVKKTSQPLSQHIASPAQQPSAKTPPSAPQPQIKHSDIWKAVDAGDLPAVRSLIARDGKNILDKRDESNSDKKTPFLLTAKRGHVGIMKVMYESKPDVLQQTDEVPTQTNHPLCCC
ncbi:unnamed protein product [Vitrella brassicaformis CCMP3155]|uniref:Protein kinase domain-containing protein n=1 Tax=Vitrella brassicaformis (strain CCMP3155) TaxID=1169540 RepID=A0A0G4GL17_VITBC|nr:unnamed protein product [Vitrella brassicaformis CCMP3155]|eukprot:CEM30732.1 unnamed protein product [Vitrella brassicaformis CCMP3155]